MIDLVRARIEQALATTGLPIMSEEGPFIPMAQRQAWPYYWLVDPLDGTKEFIAGSEEFTVNVALIDRGRVVFGVVGMPTSGRCYFGGAGLGAWRSEAAAEASCSQRPSSALMKSQAMPLATSPAA